MSHLVAFDAIMCLAKASVTQGGGGVQREVPRVGGGGGGWRGGGGGGGVCQGLRGVSPGLAKASVKTLKCSEQERKHAHSNLSSKW